MSVFVNQIDDLIDKSLDRFFSSHVHGNKLYSKLSNEVDYVKYQMGIHTALDEFTNEIDMKAINAVITDANNIKRITDILKRYAAYYSLLWIAYHYKGKRIEFINNMVEMGTGQQRSTFRITNFYNSDNNAILFRLFDLIKDIIFVLSIDKPKSSILATPQGVAQYRYALDFIDGLGNEFVQEHLKIKGPAAVHNLIKTLIVMKLYQGEEKIDTIRILQEAELERGEYTYIDIVVPRVQHFDFSTIEGLLTPRQLREGLAEVIYDTFNELAERKEMSIDEKVSMLMANGILVPIVEDFVLIHRDGEKYEREQKLDKRTRVDDTRLRYIVSKIDAVAELYSAGTINNAQRKEQIEKLMYAPLKARKAVLVNELEEIKIINKIENQGKQTENTEFYHDLLNYRTYPYISFKALHTQGFTFTEKDTILAVRSNNFEFGKELQNVPIETRSANSTTPMNVVGFMIRPLGSPIQCYKVNDVIDIRKLTIKSRTSGKVYQTDNGYVSAIRFLKQSIIKGLQDGPAMHWMLDIEKDKFDIKGYEPISSSNMQEYLKLMLAHIYDSVEQMISSRIIGDLTKLQEKGELFSITKIERYIKEVERRTIPLNPRVRENIAAIVFADFYPKGSDAYDYREDMYPGIDNELNPVIRMDTAGEPKIPNLFLDAQSGLSQDTGDYIKPIKKVNGVQLTAGMAADSELENDDETENRIVEYISKDENYQHAICQHILSWQETMQYQRSKDNMQYEESLFNFIQTFIRKTDNDDYVCKSCDEILQIKHFVVDGVYDDEQQRFIPFSTPMDIPLEDIREYEKYGRIIRYLDLRIAAVCEMINLKFFVGSTSTIKWRRKGVVKNVLDLLLTHNRILKNNYKKRNDTASQTYGIDRKLSNLFFFDIDDTVVDYSSREKDFFRLIKLNNVTAYIIFALLLEMNDEQIANLGRDKKARVDKICTLGFYERVAPTLFDNLLIMRTVDGQKEAISSIPNFGYTLFIISCILTRNRKWNMEETDKMAAKSFDPLMQKSILHTVTDLINSIVEVYALPDANRPWLYTMIGGRFMNHMKTVYESPRLTEKILQLYSPVTQIKEKRVIVPKEKIGTLVVPSGTYRFKPYTPFTREKSIRLKWAGHIAARVRTLSNNITGIIPLSEEYIDRDTNCNDGKFHEWESKGTDFKCKNCGETMERIIAAGDFGPVEKEKLLNAIYMRMINHLSLTICINGQNHTYNSKGGKLICSYCKREKGQPLLDDQILLLRKIIERQKELPKVLEYEAKIPATILKQAQSLYVDKPATELVKTIEKILGKDAKLTGNRELLTDTYIIEKDYVGNKLAKPIILSMKDGKLKMRENHQVFKTNILYYTDENKEVDVYYDAITNAYLGFRERNREYIFTDDPHYLQVNWSLVTQIELIGFSGIHMRLSREAIELGFNDEMLNDKESYEEFIDIFYTKRYRRVIQSIAEIQRIIYTIKNGYVVEHQTNDDGEEIKQNITDPAIVILQQYAKMLSKIELGSGDTRLFANFKTIMDNIPLTKIIHAKDNINLGKHDEWLSAHDLSKDDTASKAALHYMVIEFTRLLEFNNEKFMATNLINLIVDLINYAFNMWNQDYIENDVQIKKFIVELDIIHHNGESRKREQQEAETEIADSEGTGTITDAIPDDQVTTAEDLEEMTSLSDLIEGGAEMEKDEEFIDDYSNDRRNE
jgi:hypothetical protein